MPEPATPAFERGVVRAGGARDPRRRRLAGALVRLGGGHAVHGGLGGRGLRDRRRGDALHRPGPVLRRGAARARAPGRDVGRGGGGAHAARRSARRHPARCCWPRRSARGCPGCEQVRLVSSGTEAAMSAVRLARGVTGRDRVVKFDGCYHGHSDGLLAGGGSGVAMLGLPGLGGRLGGCGGRHRGGALQRRARARRARGLRHRRAGGGEHEPGGARTRLPRGAACRVRRGRQRC